MRTTGAQHGTGAGRQVRTTGAQTRTGAGAQTRTGAQTLTGAQTRTGAHCTTDTRTGAHATGAHATGAEQVGAAVAQIGAGEQQVGGAFLAAQRPSIRPACAEDVQKVPAKTVANSKTKRMRSTSKRVKMG